MLLEHEGLILLAKVFLNNGLSVPPICFLWVARFVLTLVDPAGIPGTDKYGSPQEEKYGVARGRRYGVSPQGKHRVI